MLRHGMTSCDVEARRSFRHVIQHCFTGATDRILIPMRPDNGGGILYEGHKPQNWLGSATFGTLNKIQ